jgi:hypothetical protein
MSDEHTLKKVERGVAARNLETTGTSASSLSLLQILAFLQI